MNTINRSKVLKRCDETQLRISERLRFMRNHGDCYSAEDYHRILLTLAKTGLPWKHITIIGNCQVRTKFGSRLRKITSEHFTQNHRLDDLLNEERLPHKIQSTNPKNKK